MINTTRVTHIPVPGVGDHQNMTASIVQQERQFVNIVERRIILNQYVEVSQRM